MSVAQQQAEVPAAAALPKGRTARRQWKPSVTGNWWRHIVAIAAVLFALFPVVYVASAAFNADQSLTSSSLIPRAVTLDNFRTILSGEYVGTGGSFDTPYLLWYRNSIVVALATAFCTVLLGALAAYAFSRFRFKGRRLGMLTLLLIQMFPQFLALVAIYLIL